jgi:hypothetical protein
MLLCLLSLQRRSVFEDPIEATGEVALETADRFASTSFPAAEAVAEVQEEGQVARR